MDSAKKKDIYLGSRLIGKIRSIRFVTLDVAIMIAVGGTVMVGQSDIEPERNSIHTIVAVTSLIPKINKIKKLS